MPLTGVVPHADLVLDPHHTGAVREPPGLDNPHSLGKLRACAPEEKHAIISRNTGHIKLADCIRILGRVLILDLSADRFAVLIPPWRIDIDQVVRALGQWREVLFSGFLDFLAKHCGAPPVFFGQVKPVRLGLGGEGSDELVVLPGQIVCAHTQFHPLGDRLVLLEGVDLPPEPLTRLLVRAPPLRSVFAIQQPIPDQPLDRPMDPFQRHAGRLPFG